MESNCYNNRPYLISHVQIAIHLFEITEYRSMWQGETDKFNITEIEIFSKKIHFSHLSFRAGQEIFKGIAKKLLKGIE